MAAPTLDFRNTNALWCSVIAETLARLGLRHAVVSPGSRCAPLTFAFARHPQFEAIPVLDERSAAFFALGLARQHRRPTVLVCTSGTAAANFLPAVIEAQESGVPLLIFTADRPPEMRACASGQTIDQQKLYGSHVNFYHELAVPEAKLELLRYVRQTVMHAAGRTRFPWTGPVHLNAPFRDPLPPVEDGLAEALQPVVEGERFFAHLESAAAQSGADLSPALPDGLRGRRGVIVAGPAQPADPAAYCAAVGRLSAALGWPVLADGISPVRHFAAANPLLVVNYNGVLRSPALAERLKPEAVLGLGAWPTSRQLRQFLQAAGAEMWLLSDDAQNRDALHGHTRPLRGSVETLAGALAPAAEAGGAGDYAQAWLRADQAAGHALDARLSTLEPMFEGKVSRLLPRQLPVDTPVFVASSMPVRDVEFFWEAGDRHHRLYFNRGANGIDGTLSSACGVAHGNRPAVLLSGDLALLHDTNGFLLRPKLRGSLTVVLINNRGGGIFEMLPVAEFDPPFEEFFATPQEVDFTRLCAAFGAEHVLVRDWRHLSELVSVLPSKGLRVLEVRADRKRDAATRRELFAAAAQAAEAALAG
ncbi:MAG TPA: 2-succinyl-5-enolpyruvyl-6-hydroxy-3-cyclohexene-1-carboxylic-acid synthase [Opitutaceae bacterium]|nr:2-succinyl-5-enolpyruvyl-6-hydroxy-3-cyclohexene-1-carboxylic-acid synthase [Opitutaceae bacterium]